MTMPIASTPSPGVTGAGSSSDGTSSTTAAEDGTASLLDPSTFLSLLVDELKYQNPLDPTSSSDFMSQIAELSQVEQLQAVSSSSQIGEASGLIGKTITSPDGSTSGQVASVSVTSSGAVATLANGATVPLANGASIQ